MRGWLFQSVAVGLRTLVAALESREEVGRRTPFRQMQHCSQVPSPAAILHILLLQNLLSYETHQLPYACWKLWAKIGYIVLAAKLCKPHSSGLYCWWSPKASP